MRPRAGTGRDAGADRPVFRAAVADSAGRPPGQGQDPRPGGCPARRGRPDGHHVASRLRADSRHGHGGETVSEPEVDPPWEASTRPRPGRFDDCVSLSVVGTEKSTQSWAALLEAE